MGVVGEQIDELAPGDHLDTRSGDDVFDIAPEYVEPCRHLSGWSPRSGAPLVARWHGSPPEVDAVPEGGGRPFARVVVDADKAAAVGHLPLVDLVEATDPFRQPRVAAVEGAAGHGVLHPVDVQHAAEPEGLAITADVGGFIHEQGNTGIAQEGVELWRPGAAGLTEGRRRPKDAGHVVVPGALAADDLLDAILPTGVGEVFGQHRVLRVVVGVVADVLALQQADDVTAATLLEDAGLFGHHLPRGLHAAGFEDLEQPLESVVTLGREVILDVEPEQRVDGTQESLR
ncbi:MAG: hypothetical protein CME04_06220 [Gemmatimonadaceae bacterium]|nr:hypothetical protein [Gemmatimonadaceae bacterium]